MSREVNADGVTIESGVNTGPNVAGENPPAANNAEGETVTRGNPNPINPPSAGDEEAAKEGSPPSNQPIG